MGWGQLRSRRIRSGESDESDAEGPAGLEEYGGVVRAITTVNEGTAMKVLDKFPDRRRRAKRVQTPDTISPEELQKGCLAFQQRERRDAMYKTATFLVKHFWGKPTEVAEGLGVLLFVWNHAFYRLG